MLCEVCIDAPAGVVAARQGGAARVELCAALEVGGLTPSAGAVRRARDLAAGGLEVVVLIRPRPGDFCYDDDELAVMLDDVRQARAAGVAGVAIGCLTPAGAVDEPRCRALLEAARPLAVTFHRAFDHAADPAAALAAVIELGCDRLLTSGQAANVEAGLVRLRWLVEHAADRVRIMPGGGVREHNIRRVIAATGARDIHFSARSVLRPTAANARAVPMAAGAAEIPGLTATDAARVRAFRAALRPAGVE